MDEKIDAKKYEEKYKAILAYEEEQHRANQHRIRVGIRLNPIIPLVFLILSFLNSDSKLIFLILWIASLFGIAFYLMYVEYSDYVLQEKMKEFGFRDEDEKTDALVGHGVAAASDAVIDRAGEIDEKITETKADIREKIDSGREAAKDALASGARATKDILESRTEKMIDRLEDALLLKNRRTRKTDEGPEQEMDEWEAPDEEPARPPVEETEEELEAAVKAVLDESTEKQKQDGENHA